MLLRLMCISLLVSSVSGFAQTAKFGGTLQWKKAKDGRDEYLALQTPGGKTYSLLAVKSIQPEIVKLAETQSAVDISGELRPGGEVVVRQISSK
jgi:hypothetical protein